MRKLMYGVLLMAFAALLVSPLVADDSKVDVHAEVWSRTEYLENFTDFTDSTGTPPVARDNIDFTMYRARIDLNVEVSDTVGACIEVQNFGVWGNSFPFESNAQDPVAGAGAINGLTGGQDTTLYQANVRLKNIGGTPLSLKVGRQEHTLGNELHLGDADYYGGQFFDGIRGGLDFEAWDMDFFYYKIQERSVWPGSIFAGSVPLNGGADDSDLWGMTANFKAGEGHNLEPYFLYKRDGNELGSTAGPKYNAGTLGVLYDHARSDDSMFDWGAEVAIQQGEVFGPGNCPAGTPDCDLSSYIAEGHFGVSFGPEQSHRVAVGGLLIGDGDDAQDREDFMSLYPDTHRRAGAMDLFSELSTGAAGGSSFSNLTNYYLSYDWMGDGPHGFGAAFHFFTATEDFGAPEDEIGQELDLKYTYKHGEHVSVAVAVGQFMPGDVFTAPSDEDAMRASAMLRFRN